MAMQPKWWSNQTLEPKPLAKLKSPWCAHSVTMSIIIIIVIINTVISTNTPDKSYIDFLHTAHQISHN